MLVEMIPNCPHGSPYHWIVDLWYWFLLLIPGAKYALGKLGIKFKSLCCGHKEVAEKDSHALLPGQIPRLMKRLPLIPMLPLPKTYL